MDGSPPDGLYQQERRRRLAAERMLDRAKRDLSRAHAALVANADRLSRDYLSERETNLRLTERQAQVLAQRKEAAEKADRARRRLWHALEAMRDGFALFDAQGTMVAANHVYLNLFDCAGVVGPGASAAEMFEIAAEEGSFDTGGQDEEEWADAMTERWRGDRFDPMILRHYDGRIIRLSDRRAPDGDLVSLAVDVTEDEARVDALAAARDSAEATARMKADFLARMSHEIRTPMNGVIGLADMLAEQVTDEEGRLSARTIRDSAEALLTIVNDTLDVSKIEAGKMDLRADRFDLEAMLRDCIRLAQASGRARVPIALSWPLDASAPVVGDEGRVRQIVMNLLGNAMKFTAAGGVTVRVARAPDVVSVTVADTGPGIADALRDTIFEAFGQADDPGMSTKEGTGLGLTISRGLAQRMGGTLHLSDEVGPGATFVLTLPLRVLEPGPPLPSLPDTVALGPGVICDALAESLSVAGIEVVRTTSTPHPLVARAQDVPADAVEPIVLRDGAPVEAALAARARAVLSLPAAAADLVAALALSADDSGATEAVSAASRGATRRILLADDNQTNRFLLDRMLADGVLDYRIVEDGAEAVAAQAEGRFDAVVLDISMPVLDGIGAAAAIRAAEAEAGLAPVPLLALTAHTGDEMGERLRAAGFVAHLTKPLKKQVLLEALEAAWATQGAPGQPSVTS
ncbi:ATP-binding protein [uncultured Jannaschia sp.]|uniref:ATP-binding protein n=1 Tax=uncultured Jannaschia sp. TaxID=293347 RepID=UPI00262A8806|nr:ATP-binding protein [uncultured Jannaschia sp.]